MKKFFKMLCVALMVGFLAGLFFPQVVQAYWSPKEYFPEWDDSGPKYDGGGYNAHGYYYFQYGSEYTYSWLTWGQDSGTTDRFNWQAHIPSSNTGRSKAYVRYEGEVSTRVIDQSMYNGWTIVLSDTPTNYSTLYMSNVCIPGQTCNGLEVEWDDVNSCFWIS